MNELIREIAASYQAAVAYIQLATAPGTFIPVGSSHSIWIAVALPTLLSAVLLYNARRRLGQYPALIRLWWISLPLMYFTSYWREADDVLSLQIVVLFSMGALCLVWRRHPVAPGLAYALTFVSLLIVDVARAVQYALDEGYPLSVFLRGVGGAGMYDGLFIFPLLTAVCVVYAHWRQSGNPKRALAVEIHRRGFMPSK